MCLFQEGGTQIEAEVARMARASRVDLRRLSTDQYHASGINYIKDDNLTIHQFMETMIILP